MEAVEAGGDVDVDDVAGREALVGARDAVADDVVPAGAHRGREAVVAELAGGAAAPRRVLAHPAVDVRGGDPGREARGHVGERRRRGRPCAPQRRLLPRPEELDAHGARVAVASAPASNTVSVWRRAAAREARRGTLAAVSLAQIRYFVAVAEEGHVGRAARRMHVSQPPVTRQIRSLEGELGAQLFLRTPRGVRLLPAGEAFLSRARRILGEVDAAVSEAREKAIGAESA